jgi:hypothetical protein
MPVFWMCFIASGGNCQFMQPEYQNYYSTPSACARMIEKDKKSILDKMKNDKNQPDIFGSNCVWLTIETPRFSTEDLSNSYRTKNVENSLALDVSAYKTKVIKAPDLDELEKEVEVAAKKPVAKTKEVEYILNEAPKSFVIDCMRYMSLSKSDCEKSWFIK